LTAFSWKIQFTYDAKGRVGTAPVRWQWDAAYPRIASMQDGIGRQTLYSYVAAEQPGAGRFASVDGPFASETITFFLRWPWADERLRLGSHACA
jgi:hypothetical protein